MSKMFIAAVLTVLTAAPALPQESKAEPDSEAARIVADCSARKFESSIEIDKDGRTRLTSFRLCAAKDADDAAWVRTLKDARAKILAHPDISADSKTSIAAQLDVEIAKYEAAPAPTAVVAAPDLPPALITPPTAAPAVPATTTVATVAKPVPKPAAPKPRLTIRCLEPGEKGSGSRCSSLGRATRLEISADADLGGGTSLRFLRRGDERAQLALAPMRQGELFRTKLPPELCAGVASSKVEIQIMGGKQVVDTLGPYNLRC